MNSNEQTELDKTPRTDAVYGKYELHCTSEEVRDLHAVAIALERELNAATCSAQKTERERNELKRDMQILLVELEGFYEGLSYHPNTPNLEGFCISIPSKEKLKHLQEIIKRYERL